MTQVKRVFVVDGKPFYPLGAQSDNSSGYNDTESDTALQAVKLLHGNTLEIPVYWDKVEPKEGKFDFTSVDALLTNARRHAVRLILLWFATWKNGNMDYAPVWVKTNKRRFKRAVDRTGNDLWVLSAYCPANLEADKKAFAALCKHLKAQDSTERTVLSLQVENEPCTLGTYRDYGSEAMAVFDSPVPAYLLNAMTAAGKGEVYDIWQRAGGKKSGSWPEIFGPVAGEMVSAWSIATYIDSVAEAGKAIYDIPMFINGSIGVIGSWRGQVPDEIVGLGEPVPKVLDIYKWFTPHVDLVAPDIHIRHSKGYEAACAAYNRSDNPLFECESGPNTWSMFRGIADYNSIGYFFYGAENIVAEDGSVRPEFRAMVDSVQCIASAIPLLLKYQGTGKIQAVLQEENMEQHGLDFDGYLGQAQFSGGRRARFDWRHSYKQVMTREQGDSNRGRGLVIQASKQEFYLVGANYRLFLRPKLAPEKMRPLLFYDEVVPGRQLSVDEGHFNEYGNFVVDRQRNGDPVQNGIWVEPDVGVIRVIICD